MRHRIRDTSFDPSSFRGKIRANGISQFNRIFEYLGWSFVAPVAFVCLLHAFHRPVTARLRWLFLAMWAGAVLGMAVFGINDEQGVAANQLHLLFMPLMTAYGLAFLLVQLDRRIGLGFLSSHWAGHQHRLIRKVLVGVLFLLCGIPMICSFFVRSSNWKVRWPPYLPPYIAVIGDWLEPGEITASDMPWAVAWYGNTRSLWLPDTVKSFNELRDYNKLGAPINGLYLTPVSGSLNSLGDILNGDYAEWAPLILRKGMVEKFPLFWATAVGMQDCMYYSDRNRQPVSEK
jgi:hypothetical protein